MKVFICVLAILYLAVFVSCEQHYKVMKDCKKETGIEDEIKPGQKPDFSNEKVRNYFVCVLKKFGTLKENKIFIEDKIKDLQKFINTIKTCADKANSATVKDDGERAAKYKECLFDGMKDAKNENAVE